ncbi:hypothetical protein C8R48DRAFT_214401 [Suillus tomentosus]|nr:hypothetical protein C8R48DRAFT_214401 [Suillus tomentosus]
MFFVLMTSSFSIVARTLLLRTTSAGNNYCPDLGESKIILFGASRIHTPITSSNLDRRRTITTTRTLTSYPRCSVGFCPAFVTIFHVLQLAQTIQTRENFDIQCSRFVIISEPCTCDSSQSDNPIVQDL